jgi:hypothetical protein
MGFLNFRSPNVPPPLGGLIVFVLLLSSHII